MINLIEKPIAIRLAHSYVSLPLKNCVGIAAKWLKNFNDFSATALVPENMPDEHLRNFETGDLPEASESSLKWLSNYLKENYIYRKREYIIIFQDIWALKDDSESNNGILTRISLESGVYYYIKINQELIRQIDKAVFSGISFFTLGFVIEKDVVAEDQFINLVTNIDIMNSCELVIFGAYDQESFLLFHRDKRLRKS